MNKVLIICPTYNRPKQYTEMAESFYNTQTCSDMITLTAKGSITKLINRVNYSGYKYIGVTNDDVIYHTEGWDEKLIESIERKGKGIAFGNDGTNNRDLPAISIMSASIPKMLGWIQYPRLTHLCGDMVYQYIGKKLNCLHYNPYVHIEHRHYLFGKGKKEDYAKTNSKEMYNKDNATFQKWIRTESDHDIRAVQMAL